MHDDDAAVRARKRLLKSLATAHSASWRRAALPVELAGTTRLETRRKSYRFENGICVDVTRRDGEGDGVDPLLGMKIVGWVLGDHPAMLSSWRPGACAVLWRASGVTGEETQSALTSPSFAFFNAINSPQQVDVREEATSRFHAKELVAVRPPATSPLQTQSMTRMFF